MLARLVARWAMHAGSCIVLNMVRLNAFFTNLHLASKFVDIYVFIFRSSA